LPGQFGWLEPPEHCLLLEWNFGGWCSAPKAAPTGPATIVVATVAAMINIATRLRIRIQPQRIQPQRGYPHLSGILEALGHGAILTYTNLEGVRGVTNEQLEQQAKSLEGATMPTARSMRTGARAAGRAIVALNIYGAERGGWGESPAPGCILEHVCPRPQVRRMYNRKAKRHAQVHVAA
jgi:hypothetical protein